MNKPQLITALRAFCSQRSGMDPQLYGSRESFLGDYRPMIRAGADARAMLKYIGWRDGITVDHIVNASKVAFSGRLSISERGGSVVIDYCTGQFFATEYRAALCRVLAKAIHDYLFCNIKAPTSEFKETDARVKKTVANELGRGLAKRWF